MSLLTKTPFAVTALRSSLAGACAATVFLVSGCGSGSSAPNTAEVHAQASTSPVIEQPPNPCGPKQTDYFITDYQLTSLYTLEGLSTDFDTTSGSISWQTFGLKLSATKQLAMHTSKRSWLRFSLFNTAYACAPGWESISQDVVSFRITSNELFSESYPAGSDLTALFTPTYLNYNGSDNYYENSLETTIAVLLDETPTAPQQLELKLNQAPEFNYHTFTLTIGLDDGSVFTTTTEPIDFEI